MILEFHAGLSDIVSLAYNWYFGSIPILYNRGKGPLLAKIIIKEQFELLVRKCQTRVSKYFDILVMIGHKQNYIFGVSCCILVYDRNHPLV